MGKNSRRRNPPRKASMPLRSLDTNSFENKRRKKSRGKAILADDVQEQNNETSAIAWTNDKDANDAPTAEHAASATEEALEEDEEVAIDSKYQSKHPPKVVTFEMLKDYLHKPEFLDRNLLLEIIELGKQAFEILLRNGKAVSMEEFRKDHKISRTAQEAYSTGQTRIAIPRIPREKNEMNKDRSRVGVYLIVFKDEHGKVIAIKTGVNGDGMREGDYDQESKEFEYVEVVSFHNASEEAEADLRRVYIQYLERMVNKADCPSDLRLLYKLALEGGMSCSLLRKPIMLAVESYTAFEFGVEGHLDCNPHEMIAGKEDIVREQKRIHDDISGYMKCDIKEATGNRELTIAAANTTWVVDEKCSSNNGENFRSAQVDIMKYTIDLTPFDKKDVKAALPDPPKTKLVEGEAYCTNYSPPETREGREVISQAQERVADTEGGVGITYFNSVVTKHSDYNDLVEFLIDCHKWSVWRVYVSKKGAKVYILYKNGSVYLVLNSPCRALDPTLPPDDLQDDILNIVEVVRSVLGSLNWKNEVGEIETNHEYGYLIPLVSQRLKLMSIGPYYISKLLHKLFVPDEIRQIYLQQYNNLPRTEYVTTYSDSCRMWFYYKDSNVFSLLIRSEGLRNYIEKKFKKRSLKANLNHIARSEEEFESIMTTLIQLLTSIYKSKNDPAKREVLKKVFRHLYDQFRDAKGGFNVGKDWKSTEIKLYIKGFKHRYGNVLHELIPTDSNFDHVAIRAWIPTRGGKSCSTFKNNIMKNVKNKNRFTFEMYLVEVQKRLKTVCKWEEYSSHYLVDKTARFKDFETNKRVVQMFVDKVDIYNDRDRRDQFIEDFVSDLEHEGIKVYDYDHKNFSFHLKTDLVDFFTTKFTDWKWRYC